MRIWDGANATYHSRLDSAGMLLLTGQPFASFKSKGWNTDADMTKCSAQSFYVN